MKITVKTTILFVQFVEKIEMPPFQACSDLIIYARIKVVPYSLYIKPPGGLFLASPKKGGLLEVGPYLRGGGGG